MPKTTRTPSNDGITDVTQCTIQQLTRLPIEVLRFHLSSRKLIVTGTKAVLACRLYDGIHPPPSSDVTPVSIATSATQPGLLLPSSTSVTGTSTLQATPSSLLPPQPATSANISPLNLPPAMQAQLSSPMAQFLQNATPATANDNRPRPPATTGDNCPYSAAADGHSRPSAATNSNCPRPSAADDDCRCFLPGNLHSSYPTSPVVT